MNKRDEFKIRLDCITKIFLISRDNFYYSEYLYSPKTKIEENYINIDRDLKFIRHSIRRVAIIELTKIVKKSNNNKFNIFKLLDTLKSQGYFKSLGFDEIQIGIFESDLSNYSTLIDAVIGLRDNIYAHTDGNEIDFAINFDELNGLYDVLENVICRLSIDLLDENRDLRRYNFIEGRFNILEVLAINHYNKTNEFLVSNNLPPKKS